MADAAQAAPDAPSAAEQTVFETNSVPAAEPQGSTLSPEAEAAKQQLSALQVGSSFDLIKDMNAELASHNNLLLARVRTSVAAARKNKPNLRFAQEDDTGGMKSVDMDALLGIIKEAEVKRDLQKAIKESEKMVKDISNLLSSEGFL